LCTVSADAATTPLPANSEAAVVRVLGSTKAGDGASEWYAELRMIEAIIGLFT